MLDEENTDAIFIAFQNSSREIEVKETTQIGTLGEARASTRAALSIAEVARVLGVDPRTVSAATASGELPSVRLGRRVLIPREPLIALLDRQAVAS